MELMLKIFLSLIHWTTITALTGWVTWWSPTFHPPHFFPLLSTSLLTQHMFTCAACLSQQFFTFPDLNWALMSSQRLIYLGNHIHNAGLQWTQIRECETGLWFRNNAKNLLILVMLLHCLNLLWNIFNSHIWLTIMPIPLLCN